MPGFTRMFSGHVLCGQEEDDKNKEEMLAHGHGASNALKQLLAQCVKIGAHGNVHEISDYLREQIYAEGA